MTEMIMIDTCHMAVEVIPETMIEDMEVVVMTEEAKDHSIIKKDPEILTKILETDSMKKKKKIYRCIKINNQKC